MIPSPQGQRISVAMLLMVLIVATGCAPVAQTRRTQAFLLQVRQSPETGEIQGRLLSVEIETTTTDEAMASEVLTLPHTTAALRHEASAAAAAPNADGSAGADAQSAAPPLFALATHQGGLTIERLAERDLFLVLASPGREVLADLRLLQLMHEIPPCLAQPAAETAVEPLATPELINRVQAMVQAGEARQQAAARLTVLEAEVRSVDAAIDALRAEEQSLLEAVAAAPDDPQATRTQRLRLADLGGEIDPLVSRKAELAEAIAGVQQLSADVSGAQEAAQLRADLLERVNMARSKEVAQ